MSNQIQTLIDNYIEARKAFLEQGKEAVSAMFKQFFVDHPEVTVIKWSQYSPYFNDGDECVFSVHAPTFSNIKDPNGINRWGEIEEIDEDEEETTWAYGDDVYGGVGEPPDALIPALDEMDDLIQGGALEDVFHDFFGNHVIVTVTPNGISTDDCDHD